MPSNWRNKMNTNTKEIEMLQKQKNNLLKQVDPLIAKKKKLYSDVDITTPKSSDEKKLDKEIADLFSEINDLVHKIVKLKKSQNEGKHTMKLKSVNEVIAVGKMVKVVDNPHWEAALGKKGPFKRKVKMIVGDNVFFTDGSNSSMKYVKEDIQLTNEADLNWNAVQNAIINFLKVNTKILDKRVQAKDGEGVKAGLKSIISGLTNAQRSLKLESVMEGLSLDVAKLIANIHKGFKMVEDDGVMVYDSPSNAKKAADFLNSKKIAASSDGKYVYLESIISGLTNAQRSLKLESVNEAKYPTDLKIGSVILGQGFTMLKGIDGGQYYKIVDMDDFSATLVPSDKNGNVKGSKKVRHKLDSIEGGIKTAKRGDENGIVVIKESVNEAYDVETLPHLKKVSNEYYVDTPFIQYSNKFGNLAHVGFGDFLLKTSDGEVYFARTSKQLPGFVGRTHTMSGDATAIKKLIASMSSKYELNENVKKSTYNRVARILNNGKLDIY
jgi:hypothetical protein